MSEPVGTLLYEAYSRIDLFALVQIDTEIMRIIIRQLYARSPACVDQKR